MYVCNNTNPTEFSRTRFKFPFYVVVLVVEHLLASAYKAEAELRNDEK